MCDEYRGEMESRWKHLKEHAIALRKDGKSIREIEEILRIPRSTLSGWFKNIVLSPSSAAALAKRSKEAFIEARLLAAQAHRENKQRRIALVRDDVEKSLHLLPADNLQILEIALAMLYLGEGGKTGHGVRLGNSNPNIMRFYLNALCAVYGIPIETFYFALHLRADQDEQVEKIFWSQALDVPESSFRYCIKDPRTAGKPTRDNYHGVCLASGGSVEIQRKLMYLSEAFCERVTRG